MFPKNPFLEQIEKSKFKIKNAPGYENIIFISSDVKNIAEPMDLAETIADIQKQNMIPASAQEAAAFIVANGWWQNDVLTRTSVVYFSDNSILYIALDDDIDSSKNIILANVREGLEAHSCGKFWTSVNSDSLIKNHLSRAEKSDRIYNLEEFANGKEINSDLGEIFNSLELRISLENWSSHKLVHHVLGEISEQFTPFISEDYGRKGGILNIYPLNLLKQYCQNSGVVVSGLKLDRMYSNIYGLNFAPILSHTNNILRVQNPFEFIPYW